MATPKNEFTSYVLEQLTDIRELSCKPMFGGFGLRSGETFFGLIMDEALYFAVDDETRGAYENLGSKCFSYAAKGRPVASKRYFEVPGEIIEDYGQLLEFARSAIRAAGAYKSQRKPQRRKMTGA